MKEVKLLGLTDRWSKEIQSHRVQELELSKKARILSVYRLVICEFNPLPVISETTLGQLTRIVARISTYLTPAITFGVFIAIAQRHGGNLSVSMAFTSLSLISLLSSPLSLIFTALPQAAMTLACFSRIQDFLVEEDRDEVLASQVVLDGKHI
jgi:ATP-binding cassette subfamily C (CFTR/MRP) protein 1